MNDWGQGAHNNVVGWGQAAKSGMGIVTGKHKIGRAHV